MSPTGQSITITNIRKLYGHHVALDDVCFSADAGEFITLLGPSGSGKTTLLMVMAGFTRPNSGSIRFGPTEMIRTPPHKRNIGMMFQNYALFPHMTVAENIAYPLRLRRVGKSETAERVADALDLVDLATYGDRRIEQMSGGQRQRVALARAVVFRPQILLMDEPLSALDKNLREYMQDEIRRLHERLGMTTVAVTHDQREALTMSDRVAVMKDGQLVQMGSPSELYDRPVDRFVAGFLGESSFVAHEGRTLVIRPERLVIRSAETPHSTDWLRFSGRVESLSFQGDSLRGTIRLHSDGSTINVRQSLSNADETAPQLRMRSDVIFDLHRNDAIYIKGEAA